MKKQQDFIYCKRKWRGIPCEEYRLPATTSLKVPFRKKICCVLLPALLWRRYYYTVCYCQLQCEEDMLCVTVSLIMKKICCVLLPASLWRRRVVWVGRANNRFFFFFFFKCWRLHFRFLLLNLFLCQGVHSIHIKTFWLGSGLCKICGIV